ncbi:MAG: RNA polymerase sigma factor [Candidatus Acidiferrales bacterium]
MVPNTTAAVAEIDALYRQYGPALLLFATAITGERSRAQDGVHQVFLKLIQDGKLHQVADKKAYLFACVRNAVLNDARQLQRAVSLDADVAWFSAPGKDLAAETSLRRALLLLPGEQRQIVVLHLWAELTFLEIAELLEINPNTAASRYRYALVKLRESMGAVATEPVPTPTGRNRDAGSQ